MSGRAWFALGVVVGAAPTGVAASILIRAAWTQAEILAWGCDTLFRDRFPPAAAPVSTASPGGDET